MYDPVTRDVIRTAPELKGLDVSRLPELLTLAYTELASLRLRLLEDGIPPPDDFADILNELRRLANTYEAYAALLPTSLHKRGAAFVAASAHDLLYRASAMGYLAPRVGSTLTRNAISSDVSAVLLYLIAGYPSDAREISLNLDAQGPAIVDALLRSISQLASGALHDIVDAPVPAFGTDLNLDDEALEGLWLTLFRAVRSLAVILLGRIPEQDAWSFADLVDSVIEAGIREVPDPLTGRAALSTYAGPHHLALLLRAAGDELRGRAISLLPPPGDVPEEPWREYVKGVAHRRPYLWPNHVEAVTEGYLDPSISAAVTFPTGAGKSTLAQLRIASTLLQGQKVVFLAPTLALVSQVLDELREAFPEYAVRDALIGEGFYAEVATPALPDVCVMTPERCLMLMGLYPEPFAVIGLLVFDECHLLHPRNSKVDRRSLDAMFCLIGILREAKGCAVLLMSAMLSNAKEVAQWIEESFERRCIVLDLGWKPTRQVRGCVVFDQEALAVQADAVRTAFQNKRTKNPPTALRRAVRARPYGLFGLRYAWDALDVDHYAFLPLLEEEVPLGVDSGLPWQLAQNKNVVASHLAARAVTMGIKTLVFVQNKDHCASIVGQIADLLGRSGGDPALLPRERMLFDSAAEDLGGTEYVIGPTADVGAPHHSLLLTAERRLNESMFRRNDGINVLVATPTLAQGMNLPAELVLLVGDSRFDKERKRSSPMLAHELLNAAGRAGRAGYRSSGAALVITDRLIEFNASTHHVSDAWMKLRDNVFSKTDHCLELVDPIGLLLDRISEAAGPNDRLVRYFLRRLPDEAPSTENAEADGLLRSTFSAFKARQGGASIKYAEKVRRALVYRRTISPPNPTTWFSEIAVKNGLPLATIAQMADSLKKNPIPAQASVLECLTWLASWLGETGARIEDLFNPEVIALGLNPTPKRLDSVRPEHFAEITERTIIWISGVPLTVIEGSLGGSLSSGHLKKARVFVKDVVTEVSYAAGLVSQVARGIQLNEQPDHPIAVALSTLGACVREGFDDPWKLALRYEMEPFISRVAIHAIAAKLPPRPATPDFQQMRQAIREWREQGMI